MELKEKILNLRELHPDWSYRKIAKEIGCDKASVSFHADNDYRHRVQKRVKNRRTENKLFFVKKAGGKCQRCGYDKCVAALEFHHKNPLTKEGKTGIIFSLGRVKAEKEIAKCELICSNCHHEIHWIAFQQN